MTTIAGNPALKRTHDQMDEGATSTAEPTTRKDQPAVLSNTNDHKRVCPPPKFFPDWNLFRPLPMQVFTLGNTSHPAFRPCVRQYRDFQARRLQRQSNSMPSQCLGLPRHMSRVAPGNKFVKIDWNSFLSDEVTKDWKDDDDTPISRGTNRMRPQVSQRAFTCNRAGAVQQMQSSRVFGMCTSPSGLRNVQLAGTEPVSLAGSNTTSFVNQPYVAGAQITCLPSAAFMHGWTGHGLQQSTVGITQQPMQIGAASGQASSQTTSPRPRTASPRTQISLRQAVLVREARRASPGANPSNPVVL